MTTSHTITEHSSVFHYSYGWGTVTVRTYTYATVEFDSGYRTTVPASELVHTRDYGRVVEERCSHGYHVTEGYCPTCDRDKYGKCGPFCTHLEHVS